MRSSIILFTPSRKCHSSEICFRYKAEQKTEQKAEQKASQTVDACGLNGSPGCSTAALELYVGTGASKGCALSPPTQRQLGCTGHLTGLAVEGLWWVTCAESDQVLAALE